MKVAAGRLVAVASAVLTQAALADFDMGAKLWYVRFADGAVGDMYLLGPKTGFVCDDFWISGTLLIGRTRDEEHPRDFKLRQAEVPAGLNLSLSVGRARGTPGCRVTKYVGSDGGEGDLTHSGVAAGGSLDFWSHSDWIS